MNKRFLTILMIAGFSLSPNFRCDDALAGPESNSPPFSISAVPPAESAASNDALHAYLQLQEQIHETQLAIERAGRETELAVLRNAAVLSNRLQAVEDTMNQRTAHELEIVRAMLIIVGAFVVVGGFALLLTAYFHWRTVSRLTEIITAMPAARGLGSASSATALGLGENQMLLEQTNSRLLDAMERLEKRILEIERSSGNQLPQGQPTNGSRESNSVMTESLPRSQVKDAPARVRDSNRAEQFVLLVDKGQTLLNGDQPAEALTCFDEALAFDPSHAELLVKKGEALERLRRIPEAVESYDRAIVADGSMTIAYLRKGGLLNRLERFDEAMGCYEQALRTQEKKLAT